MGTVPNSSNYERVSRITIKAKDANGQLIEIGAVQEISPAESREVTPHFTFGGQNPEEPKVLVPGLVRSKTLKLTYMALWKNGLLNAFGNSNGSGDPITTLVQQKTPITIEVVKKNADNSEVAITRYEDGYFSDLGATQDLTRGDVTLIETGTFVYVRAISSYA